jgi:hypothetical protein
MSDVKVLAEAPARAQSGRTGHCWLAAEARLPEGPRPLIVCVLLDGNMVKEVDESMGPIYYDCPLDWLDRYPQAPGPFAGPWRERVREFWAGGAR